MQGDVAAVALVYCRRGWPVFPCRRDNKRPLVRSGFHAATTNEVLVTPWWQRWPKALIGVPTGRDGAGFVVLDIDVKRRGENGFDTLADLEHAILPETPIAHTASGGLHVYFDPSERAIRNTADKRGRGIGPGLDVRGDGGYVIVPAPGSGYEWDPFANFDLLPLAPVGLAGRLGAGASASWRPSCSPIARFVALCRCGSRARLETDHYRAG